MYGTKIPWTAMTSWAVWWYQYLYLIMRVCVVGFHSGEAPPVTQSLLAKFILSYALNHNWYGVDFCFCRSSFIHLTSWICAFGVFEELVYVSKVYSVLVYRSKSWSRPFYATTNNRCEKVFFAILVKSSQSVKHHID